MQIGKGAFLIGDDLEKLMAQAKISRETLVDKGLQFARRNNVEGHFYFISNPSKANVQDWVTLNSAEKNMVIYDPMTLEAGIAKTRIENGSKQVYLQLAPGASLMIQASATSPKGKAYPYYQTTGDQQELKDGWKISFLKGGPVLPAAANLQSLGSWTDLAGEDVKKFSGTAQYSIAFAKPAFKSEQYLLDLGNVQETAEVILNGKN